MILIQFGGGKKWGKIKTLGRSRKQRTGIAQRRMQSLAIVEDLNELENGRASRLVRPEAMQISELGVQLTEEALHHGTVLGIPLIACAHPNLVLRQQGQVVVGGVLAAPVGMVDEIS